MINQKRCTSCKRNKVLSRFTLVIDNIYSAICTKCVENKKEIEQLRANKAAFQRHKEYKRTLEKAGYVVLDKGWPDLLAVKDGQIRFIEVKQLTERISDTQKQLHGLLKQFLNIETEVVRLP